MDSLGVRCAALAGLLALGAQTTGASSQSGQEQRFTSTGGVTLVEVVAFVSDKNGRPVPGLTREDFSLEEDGVRQNITNFSLVELPRSSSRTVKPTGPVAPVAQADLAGNDNRSGRSYVIVLDSQHVDPVRSGSVKQQARKFISDYVEPGDAVAVVTLGGSGNQSFTSDKARLMAVIDSFIGGKSRSAALNKLEMQVRASTDDPAKDYETAIKAADARTLLDSLRMICTSFGTVPGRRRSIVLFSEGIELDLSDMMGASTVSGTAALNASSQASTYASELLSSQRAMFDAARRNNVSLYTVDPRGANAGEDSLIMATGAPGGGRFQQPPPTRDIQNEVQRGQGILRNFAAETGGLAVVNTTDFDRGFGRIADANSTYYVLGYSPTDQTANGRYRKISVHVGRPGASVSARPGYFAATADGTAAPPPAVGIGLKGGSPWMNALLASALPVAGLGIQAVAAPIGLRGSDHLVSVVVELQSGEFQFKEEGDSIRNDIEVGFVAVDSDGKIRAGRASTGTLRLPKANRAAVSNGLRYVLELPLPSQRYQIRVGAVESGGGTAGSAVIDLDLTAPKDRAEAAGFVLGVVGDSIPTTGDYPVMKSLLAASPTASRRFSADQRLAVYVPLLGAPSKDAPAVAATLTVRRPDGTVALRSQAASAKSGSSLGTSVFGTLLELPLTGLTPGPYSLGVELANGGRAEGIAPISFVVR